MDNTGKDGGVSGVDYLYGSAIVGKVRQYWLITWLNTKFLSNAQMRVLENGNAT